MTCVRFSFDQIGTHAGFDDFPDECPHCHKIISPIDEHHRIIEYYSDGIFFNLLELHIVCPNQECRKGALYLFKNNNPRNLGSDYEFINIIKGSLIQSSFSDNINTISPSFVSIYNEAEVAENNELFQICGVGYRKAFEFLIKDYLISKLPDKDESIKKKMLGSCISEYIDNKKIKTAAERAAWLGNDETHYTRKWLNKDLNDLKKLISLTVHWIEMEVLTNELENDMPK